MKEKIIWKLTRRYLKPGYTIGSFYTDGSGKKFCDTLEDPVRDLNRDGDLDDVGEGKIPGKTAIPYGEYDVILYMSPKFGRLMPMLVGVKGFTYILIHNGATAENTDGCIVVGDNVRQGRLCNGGYYERKLVELIEKAQADGKLIRLRVQ